MKIKIKDEKYKYYYCFDTDTGFYFRSNIIENNRSTDKDPFMSNFPHLIDVGIMGECKTGLLGLCSKSGILCYQYGSSVKKSNMSYEDFKRICQECTNRTIQFALGGRGDPDTHPDFERILECCKEYKITPNFTTSGLFIDDDKAELCKRYCGAVAVSWHNADYTLAAINTLINHKVRTNIHFVLDKDSINTAIQLLENDGFPRGINAVIFLLFKPVQKGSKIKCILPFDKNLDCFFNIINTKRFPHKIGFDSCCVPAIIYYMNVDSSVIDACEASRFSCYIDSELNMMPCSFDSKRVFAEPLKESCIEDVWNGTKFNIFRQSFNASCPNCVHRSVCLGGCHLFDNINLCYGDN